MTERFPQPESDGHHEDGESGPVVRDRRRIDPTTGAVRPEAAAAAPGAAVPEASDDAVGGAGPNDPALADAQSQLAERTADLQRVQAEYANYRRRVERDRQAVADQALASVLGGLLPLLDDIDRARAHGDLAGGAAFVADGLDSTLTKLGLVRFGEAGEPFDPTVHEALTHGLSDEVSEAVCAEVYQPGYRVGERVLRPARVAVLEPEHGAPAAATPEQSAAADPAAQGDSASG